MSHIKYLSKRQSPTTPDELERMSKIPYALAIGSIMYAMTAVKNILKYLKQSKDYFLTYGSDYELCVKAEAAKEAIWIKNFISELCVAPSVASPIELYCDNNGALAQAKVPTANQKSKHVERKFYLIRDIVDRNDIKV
ncbi:hypothetical protein Sango_3073400 [Sesamum angolense]|uniref:Uncharacterized protein n=1 Tax=Sesamum angolense TaxID=2727404 RepID=A0AAE1VZC8_9LAMI|nr:hypothetical protein Sango_3073400 [Sesamum angolense]